MYKFSTSIHILNNIEYLITLPETPCYHLYNFTYVTYENRKLYIEMYELYKYCVST